MRSRSRSRTKFSRHRNGRPRRRRITGPRTGSGLPEFLRGCGFAGANLSGFRLVLDCANGAASSLAPELFRSLGANVSQFTIARRAQHQCRLRFAASRRMRKKCRRRARSWAWPSMATPTGLCSSSPREGHRWRRRAARGGPLSALAASEGRGDVGTTMTNLGLERALASRASRCAHCRRRPIRARRDAAQRGEPGRRAVRSRDLSRRRHHGRWTADRLKIACLVALEGPLDELVKDLKVFPQNIVNVKVRSKPPLESLPEVTGSRRRGSAGWLRTRDPALFGYGAKSAGDGRSRARRRRPTLGPRTSRRPAHRHRRVAPSERAAGVPAGILRPTRNLHLQKHVRRDPAHYIASSFRSRLRPR